MAFQFGKTLIKFSYVLSEWTYWSLNTDSVTAVKTVVIFPATAKHLEKYSSHESHLIYETPDDYKNILLPYVERSHFDMKVGNNKARNTSSFDSCQKKL
mgnify:FL=1